MIQYNNSDDKILLALRSSIPLPHSFTEEVDIDEIKISDIVTTCTHHTRLEVAASVTEQVISTEDPLLANMSGAPSIFVTGTTRTTVEFL